MEQISIDMNCVGIGDGGDGSIWSRSFKCSMVDSCMQVHFPTFVFFIAFVVVVCMVGCGFFFRLFLGAVWSSLLLYSEPPCIFYLYCCMLLFAAWR